MMSHSHVVKNSVLLGYDAASFGSVFSMLWCGAEEETSSNVLCECEALASPRHIYLGCSFLDPEDVRSLYLVRSRTSAKEQGYHNLASCCEAQRACPKA